MLILSFFFYKDNVEIQIDLTQQAFLSNLSEPVLRFKTRLAPSNLDICMKITAVSSRDRVLCFEIVNYLKKTCYLFFKKNIE